MQFVQLCDDPTPTSFVSHLRVLLVDDEPAVRKVMARYLREQGCIVLTAADGAQGLERLGAASFDAVVVDIQVPPMDGVIFWQLASARHPAMRDRFLFCGATPPPPALEAGRAAPFLPKPFRGAELWEALVELVGRSDGA